MELAKERPGVLDNIISLLNKVGIFSRWTNVIGLAAFVIIIVFSFIDVIMRYIFNSPIVHDVETVEMIMIVAVFFGIAHTQNEKGHVMIDLITSKLSPKARLVVDSITNLLGIVTFGLLIWQTCVEVPWVIQNNIVHSQSSPVNKAPFLIIIALGSTCLFLLLIRDFLVKMVEGRKLGISWIHHLLIWGIPIVLGVVTILFMQKGGLWQANLPTIGMVGIIVSLILFLSGMPIAFALILTAVVFVSHIRGFETALDMLRTEPYRNTGSYSWSVMAFFILMGFFCFYAKFGEDLYHAAYKWFGHLRGGLAIATVGACAAMGAIVGDTISVVATMSAIALPEMRKYGYDDKLSTGSISAGATLGPIIPPSVPFIVYGLLTRTSIGDLFLGGLVPGLVMTAAFWIVIVIWCRKNRNIGPAGDRSNWKERFGSMKAGGPILILFILVIGGIYKGVFTPTEGGAIGAFGSIVLGLAWRRFNWKNFTQALLDSGKVISMIFIMLVGATLFTRFIVWCNLTASISAFFTGLGLMPILVIVFIEIIFFALGFVVDTLVLTLIGVPIVHPIAVALGFDPIWFAVLTVMVINVGTITPPVALNLFVLKGLHKEIPMGVIFAGAMPFVAATMLAIFAVFFFHPLATWLPNALR